LRVTDRVKEIRPFEIAFFLQARADFGHPLHGANNRGRRRQRSVQFARARLPRVEKYTVRQLLPEQTRVRCKRELSASALVPGLLPYR